MNKICFNMTRGVICVIILFVHTLLPAQENEEIHKKIIETTAETTDEEIDNDNLQLDIQFLIGHPVSVHEVDEEMLSETFGLTPIQVKTFIQYRSLFGPIRNKYELQAIPYWDIATIKRILPYLSFDVVDKNLSQQIMHGQHQLLIRTSSIVEKSKGFIADSAKPASYAGNTLRSFIRYTYQYKQQLWWGITGDKDGGEPFLSTKGKGMDFTSIHLFIKRKGMVKTIALGDYTLSIGQGLIHWQALAFGKTGEAIAVYRQANLLKPYRSAGEWNFHRGIAVQFQKKKMELTMYGALNKLTANIETDEMGHKYFTAVSKSGYNRTEAEIEAKNSVNQRIYGSVLQYTSGRFRAGVSLINYSFSIPWIPGNELYKFYAIRGNSWFNSSMHYSYSIRNYFLFGELAYCKTGIAVIQGAVASLHPKLDLSLVYRNLQPQYQTLYSRTFSENSLVNNEEGLYIGLKLKPFPGWHVQGYADFFTFPWLKFRTDAPGEGQEYYFQIQYSRRKRWDIITQFRLSAKLENQTENIVDYPLLKTSRTVRVNFEKIISRQLMLRARSDLVWFQKAGINKKGAAFYLDARYQLSRPALDISGRLHYFDTDDYDTRIYAYERDLLYSFSIPAFYDKGTRYYLQLSGKLPKIKLIRSLKVQWWLRWSQTFYSDRISVGSGTDEIEGRQKSEWKCQVMIGW